MHKQGPGSAFTKILRALGLAALTVLVGLGSWSLYHIRVLHRLGTVTRGQVYQSGAMPPADLLKVARELGLKSVIDLRTFNPGEDSTNTTDRATIAQEAQALEGIGVRHIHLPTPQVPTQATVDRFLEIMRDPANRPALIHCYHGIGRTELFVAVYRMEFEHWSNDRARACTRLLLAGSSFSDTAEKGRFLIRYKPRLGSLPVPR
ncbi:protein phosphatase [Mesoterricola silvestris]|uniref:Protein phosphatase n=2 Tax=Mesoterricola silvestris TaxID=2927979 RepID=A0AA48GNH9_9BACT|nr:protein phosphatase [Mesoterricola silvestris]